MNQFCSFDMKKHLDKKANYHTHTTRCKHAVGTEREYIEKAIEAGYDILGFSDHAPHLFDNGYVSRIRMEMHELEDYVNTLERLRKEYEKDIQVLIGLEVEFLPKYFETSLKHYQEYPLDYMILGQHFVDDEGTGLHVQSPFVDVSRLEGYVMRVTEALNTGLFMYAAHPDIPHFIGNRKLYERYMMRLIEEIKKHHLPIEINCGGYRTFRHYPSEEFMELAAKQGCEFIVGIDAHAPEDLVNYDSIRGCAEMAAQFGGKVINL